MCHSGRLDHWRIGAERVPGAATGPSSLALWQGPRDHQPAGSRCLLLDEL